MNKNKVSEEISYHHNSAWVTDHACDDSGINLINTEEEVYFTCIHYRNETNDRNNNNDDNILHKYYAPFLSSKDQEDISTVTEYNSAKHRCCMNKNGICIYY